MIRRRIAMFVAVAIFGVPALAIALPHPIGTPQVDRTLLQTLTLPASGAIGSSGLLTADVLEQSRAYIFEVTGTWRPDKNTLPNKAADAAYYTTNKDSNPWSPPARSQNGSGFMAFNTKFGESAQQVAFKANHVYSFNWVGRGVRESLRVFDPDSDWDDNDGSLTVSVFKVNKVTYTYFLQQGIPPEPVPAPYVVQTIPTTTVAPGVVPGVTVTAPVPGVEIPTVAYVNHNHNDPSFPGLNCLSITIPLTTPPITTQIGCVYDAGLIPDGSSAIGGGQVISPTTICNPCPSVDGVTPTAVVPSTSIEGGVPPGSKLDLTITWSADPSRLYPFYRNGSSEVWAPFDPVVDGPWFATNAASVAATVRAVIRDSSGAVIYDVPITLPGMGQVIEGIFASKVVGI
ncbi:MAG TPA: hypothetical protein VI541_01415 [Actinomycetota bacterium]|nr:hypothetical protein [Actinomycetota bacterium]